MTKVKKLSVTAMCLFLSLTLFASSFMATEPTLDSENNSQTEIEGDIPVYYGYENVPDQEDLPLQIHCRY